jgi:hypothetical protein
MRLLLIFTFGLASILSSAQITAGVKAGANVSIYNRTLMTDEPPRPFPAGETGNGSGIGPLFGGYLGYELNDKLSLRTELLFSFRKYRNTGYYQLYSQVDFISLSQYSLGVNYDDRTTLSYLELPLLASWQIDERWSFHGGLGLGFLLGAKTEYRNERTSPVSPKEIEEGVINSTLGYTGTEIAMCIGTIYEMNNNFNIGFRYWCALNSVNQYTENMKLRANVFQLSVGYSLLKKN